MKYLVCGLPGTGKSTYVKEHLGTDGLCYDLDAIAAALRLRSPHEEAHQPARLLANDMFFAFCSYVKDRTQNIYIIRAAPKEEEIRRIMPDKVILCKKRYVRRGVKEQELVSRLNAIETFCMRNNIPIVTPTESQGYVMPVWAQKKE